MARRIPLPRLTQRQRSARWQRERRQQAITITVFGVLLFVAIGLLAWAAASRYYAANLRPAASIDGRVIPYRVYTRELGYELVKFYVDAGVPVGFENDSRIAAQKTQYDRVALTSVIEQDLLDDAARAEGFDVSPADVDERFTADFSEFRSRHILIEADKAATDKEAADKAALAKAQTVAGYLRVAPNDQELWNKLAKESSADPGSKDKGGELGFVGKGGFVKEFEDYARTAPIGQISDPVKTTFGYHVIQVEERRGPENSASVKRWLASGYSIDDIKAHERYDLLRARKTARLETGIVSPVPQIHLLEIIVGTPAPTNQGQNEFTTALKKIAEVNAALGKGTDFAEVAKQYSEDADRAKLGGDVGWFARGMLGVETENQLFALDVGAVSRQFATSAQTTWYKVIGKDPSRALDDDQRTKLKENVYSHWFDEQTRAHNVRKLVPGLEF